MTIDIKSEVITRERYVREPLPVMNASFTSRKADFIIKSSDHNFIDMGVSFHVGPIGLHLRPDEAIALAQALIQCAEHYTAALANVGGAA